MIPLTGWSYCKSFQITEAVTVAGTITVTNGNAAIVGSSSNFLYWRVGDKIQCPNTNWYTIATITDATHLTISVTYPGSNASGQTYNMQRINYHRPFNVYRSTGTDGSESIGCVTAGKVYVSTKCETDYKDIRFTLVDGTTLMDYWIESSSSSSALIWVEIPALIAGTTYTFYIHYGNSGATAVSNVTNTCCFGDDCTTTFNSPTKWGLEASTTGDITGGVMTLSNASAEGNAYSYDGANQITFPSNSVIRANLCLANVQYCGAGFFTIPLNTPLINWFYVDSYTTTHSGNQVNDGTPVGYQLSIALGIDPTYKIVDLIRDQAVPSVRQFIEGVEATPALTTHLSNTTKLPAALRPFGTSSWTKDKFFVVLYFTHTEATWGAWGDEIYSLPHTDPYPQLLAQ